MNYRCLFYQAYRNYATCNGILTRSKCTRETVQVGLHLAKSFCLPLLTYSVGALNLSYSKVRELAVCMECF